MCGLLFVSYYSKKFKFRMSMIVFETERLRLERAVPNDAAFIFKLVNSPNWLQYIGDRAVRNEEQARDYIESSFIKSYNKNGYGLYKMVLKKSEEPVGICGLVKRDFLESADIGFAILPEFEGQGLTYEAAAATMEFARNDLNVKPILAITSTDNVKSQNLLEKIGLKKINTIEQDGDKGPILLYSD